MAGWLIFVISCVGSLVVTMLIMWLGNITFTNTQFDRICELVMERERIKNLKPLDSNEIYETIAKVDKMEIKVEPAETAQPVREPTAADILIKEAKERLI